MKRKMMWLCGVGIIFLAMLACGESTNNAGTAAGTPEANTTQGTAQTQQQAAPKHFKVGQTVNVGTTWQVILNSIKASPGDGMDQPKQGMTFLLVDVSLKNLSQTEQNVSSIANFTLRDSTGQEYNETVTTFTKPPDGKVEGGSPLRGTLAYEVPSSMHTFIFAFAPDITSSGQTIWDLTD